MRTFLLVAAAAFLAASLPLPADPPPPTKQPPLPPPLQVPAGVEPHLDVVYASPDGLPQTLDLYVPKDATAPEPLIVFVHGGGWWSGDKRWSPVSKIMGQGFIVASIDYRLSLTAKYPAQLDDCKAAIRWLRANAASYHIDPGHIGLWGVSAGGNLVELMGTTNNQPEHEGNSGTPGVSSAVQAVVPVSGPSNLLDIYAEGLPKNRDVLETQGIARLLGGPSAQNPDKARAASPIFYITPAAPPFLIIHSDNDPGVPYQQAVEFNDALKKAGVDTTLLTVKGGGHGPHDPATMKAMMDFFRQHLK